MGRIFEYILIKPITLNVDPAQLLSVISIANDFTRSIDK